MTETEGPSKAELRRQLQQAVMNTGGKPVVTKKPERTSRGLRDILFDEMEELRSGDGDPQKALAVAVLSQKIMNTVRVEMEYHRLTQRTDDKEPPKIGSLELGTVADAGKNATGR